MAMIRTIVSYAGTAMLLSLPLAGSVGCDDPSIRERHASFPKALETVIMNCLHPDPGLRYASANELLEDLEAAAQGRTVLLRRRRKRRGGEKGARRKKRRR